jgi:hypothetical protein
MPPLLAALLMMEFGCDLRIIAAIDANMEWRHQFSDIEEFLSFPTSCWYDGYIGIQSSLVDSPEYFYKWPDRGGKYSPVYRRK